MNYLKLALVLLIMAGTWQVQEWRWGDKLAQAEQKADKARTKLAEKNSKLIDKHSKEMANVAKKTKKTYRKIAKISTDVMCTDDDRMLFGTSWNEAIRSPSGIDEGLQ